MFSVQRSELGLGELGLVGRVLEGSGALEERLDGHTLGDHVHVEEVQARHLADQVGDLRVIRESPRHVVDAKLRTLWVTSTSSSALKPIDARCSFSRSSRMPLCAKAYFAAITCGRRRSGSRARPDTVPRRRVSHRIIPSAPAFCPSARHRPPWSRPHQPGTRPRAARRRGS